MRSWRRIAGCNKEKTKGRREEGERDRGNRVHAVWASRCSEAEVWRKRERERRRRENDGQGEWERKRKMIKGGGHWGGLLGKGNCCTCTHSDSLCCCCCFISSPTHIISSSCICWSLLAAGRADETLLLTSVRSVFFMFFYWNSKYLDVRLFQQTQGRNHIETETFFKDGFADCITSSLNSFTNCCFSVWNCVRVSSFLCRTTGFVFP